jgi:hypothetical protein
LQSLQSCQAKNDSLCRKDLRPQAEDVSIIESDFAGLSAFSLRSDFNQYDDLLTSNKVKQELTPSSRSSETGGAKARFGSVSVSTSYTNTGGYNYWSLAGLGTPTETLRDQTIALDIADFRKRSGEMLPSIAWALAPSSVYLSSFVKETSYQAMAGGPPDRTTGISAGAFWTWNSGNASVNYWNYHLDSGRIGAASYDSAGNGFDATVSTYSSKIGLGAGFSYRQTDNLALLSKAVERGYDAYLSTAYKPRYLPDVVVDGGLGRYEYNSLVFGIDSEATYWSAGLGLDFSKFLSSSEGKPTVMKGGNRAPTAKLFYRYTVTDRGSNGSITPPSDQFVGMMFRASLY